MRVHCASLFEQLAHHGVGTAGLLRLAFASRLLTQEAALRR